jgi:hypothetical protein
MMIRYLLKIKQALLALFNLEPRSEEWLLQIDVLTVCILERNSFCRSQLQVSEDLYEVLKKTMIQSLVIQMDDRWIMQKLCLEMPENLWKNNTDAQRCLLYWTQGVKESIIKKVLMLQAPPDKQLLQAYPDKKFTWLDRIAIAAQEQPSGSIEKQRLMDDIYFSINLLRKFRQLRISDTAWYKGIYEEAWSEVWIWFFTGEASKESKLKAGVVGIEDWTPGSFSFWVYFKNQFGWTLAALYEYYKKQSDRCPQEPETPGWLEFIANEENDQEEARLPMIQLLKKAIDEPKSRDYMESNRMRSNPHVTLLHIVENILEFHPHAQEKRRKYTKTELWLFVGVNLEVIPGTVGRFFRDHENNLKDLLAFNEPEDTPGDKNEQD